MTNYYPNNQQPDPQFGQQPVPGQGGQLPQPGLPQPGAGQPGYGSQQPQGDPQQWGQQPGYAPQQPGYQQPGFPQQAGPGYPQQPAQPRRQGQPLPGATTLDWVRDIGGPALLLISLVMVWNNGGDHVRLTVTTVAGVLTAIVAILGGVFMLLVRLGVVAMAPKLAHLIRVGSQAPYLVAVIVYMILDIVAGLARGSGLTQIGIGGGIAIGLAGMALIIQPRDYELLALGGIQSPQTSLHRLINKIGLIAVLAVVALGMVAGIIGLIVGLAQAGGAVPGGTIVLYLIRAIAGVVLVAGMVGLPGVLMWRGSEAGRIAALAIGIAAAIALILDGTFGLALSRVGVETVSFFGYALSIAPVLAAIGLSPATIATRKPTDQLERWFLGSSVAIIAIAATFVALLLAEVSRLIFAEQRGAVVSTILLIVFTAVSAAGAVYVLVMWRQRLQSTKQIVPLIGLGGATLAGLLAFLVVVIRFHPRGPGPEFWEVLLTRTSAPVYVMAMFVLLPLLLLAVQFFVPQVREFYRSHGLALQVSGTQAGAGYAAPGYGQAPVGGQSPYAQPGQYGQAAQPGQPMDAGQPGQQHPYGQQAPYGQQEQFGEQAPYGQQAQFGEQAPYGQTAQYGQSPQPEPAPQPEQVNEYAQPEPAAQPQQSAGPDSGQPQAGVDLPALARQALDPNTPPAALHSMVNYRELWPYLAAAPAASPELLAWLEQTGDPVVKQYLDARKHQQ